jgi:hypothetical protein
MLDTSSERGRILRRCAAPRLVRRQSGARSTRAWLVRIADALRSAAPPGTSIGVSCAVPIRHRGVEHTDTVEGARRPPEVRQRTG